MEAYMYGNGWKDDDDDACRAGHCKRGIIVLSPTKKGRDTMALNWNATEIEAWESFNDDERKRCALFAYELMAIDIGTVHEDNTEEIYLRLEIWDRLHGGRSKYSYEDVLSYVGFRTNVYTLPRREWLERRVDQLESDLRIITRPEPEPVQMPNTIHYVGD